MAAGIFRPKYAPPGMTWREAKVAGLLRESEVYWIRYRQDYRTVRESSESTRYEDAKKLLNQRRRAVDRQEPIAPKTSRVTVAEMGERLRANYEEKGQDVPTLVSRLRHQHHDVDFSARDRSRPPDVEPGRIGPTKTGAERRVFMTHPIPEAVDIWRPGSTPESLAFLTLLRRLSVEPIAPRAATSWAAR